MYITNNGALPITGRLTKPPRLGNHEGTPVTNLSVAFENGTTPKMAVIDGREQLVYVGATSYVDVSFWGEAEAGVAAKLEKGQEVSLEVTNIYAKARIYEGKAVADIVGRGSALKPGAKAKNAVPNPTASQNSDTTPDTSDIPF